MMTDWTVIQTTVLKDKFIEDYIKLSYPDQSEEYIKILQQGNIAKQLIMSLSTLLQAFTSKEDLKP